MIALLKRELTLISRQGGASLIACLFFLSLIITLPFAIGPDLALITKLAPAILWIGAFLASLLGSDNLFKADKQDGTLDLLILSPLPLSIIVIIKALALFITTSLPLIITLPVMSLLLNLEPESLLPLMISMVIGLPALALLTTFAATIALSMNKGGILAAILVLPLAFPLLIFGVLAAQGQTNALLMELALLLIYITLLPPFSALAIKQGLA